MKKTDQIVLVGKGFGNKRRWEMLLLLQQQPDLSLGDIADRLRISDRTASEHSFRLLRAGLITKKYDKRRVFHALTHRGECIIQSIKDLP